MAARCGSEFNAVSISKEVGVSATTISEWLSILVVDALMPADGIHLYEIKASTTFHKEFISNIDYVRSLIPEVSGYSVIYDGENIPPNLINIRNI